MGRLLDLTGMRFGRWTVLRYAGYNKGSLWECRCDCGKIKNVRSDRLRYGKSTSCGCFRAKVTAKETALKISKHGIGGDKTLPRMDTDETTVQPFLFKNSI